MTGFPVQTGQAIELLNRIIPMMKSGSHVFISKIVKVSSVTLIARFMGPSWGPYGADRTQVGPCWPHGLRKLWGNIDTNPPLTKKHRGFPPTDAPWGSCCWRRLNSIPAWISNHISVKCGVEITYPFSNLNGCTIEVWEWIHFLSHAL